MATPPDDRDSPHRRAPDAAPRGGSTPLPPGDVSPTTDELLPPVPATAEGSGLDFGFLTDLALKTVYADTSCTTQRAAQRLALPVGVVDTLLQHLYREHFIEIRETFSLQNRRYAMLDRGWERVRRLLDLNAYIGAAPVSLKAYTAMVDRQEKLRPPVDHDAIRSALGSLVLPDSTLQLLGVVANSRRSLFVTGAPGKRKTSIARALQGVGHGRKRRSGVRRSGKTARPAEVAAASTAATYPAQKFRREKACRGAPSRRGPVSLHKRR